jgi:hypothetical protein
MRVLAFLVSLAAAAAAGWAVHRELAEVFGDRIPLVGGIAVVVVVLPLLFFPLLRPLADALHDRLAALNSRLRDNASGSGLSDVPDRVGDGPAARRDVRCGLCGGPGGPVCPACHEKMARR